MTTARVTHATPAAAYAHTASRMWECDTDMERYEYSGGCKDIALQLIEDNPHINVRTPKLFHICLSCHLSFLNINYCYINNVLLYSTSKHIMHSTRD